MLAELKNRLHTFLWQTDLNSIPRSRAWLIRALRIAQAVVRDIGSGLPTLRAMGLVYTTLLSLVPLLAVSFSVLKGFGVHNQVEPMLLNLLEPLGEQGVEITRRIIGFVDNVNVTVLGSLSLVFLIFTVISLLTKIEQALNFTWRIPQSRSLVQRISEYISVVMIGPVLIFSAIGLTASIGNSQVAGVLTSMESLGWLIWFAGKVVSFSLIVGAITFIYLLVPNKKVQLSSAFTGAVVAALLWKLSGWAFASFVVGSTNYSAIYSSFAILIIFMIWLYLSWLILLIGATVSFYHQHPERTSIRQQVLRLSSRLREKIALLVMLRIGQSFHHNEKPWTTTGLSKNMDIATEALALVLDALEQRQLISRTGGEELYWLPNQSLGHISLKAILDAARRGEENPHLNPDSLVSDAVVDSVLTEIEGSVTTCLGERSLLSLVDSATAVESATASPAGSG
jgi:membrane protein